MSDLNWQESYKNLITCPQDLLSFLEIPRQGLTRLDKNAERQFPLKVSREYASRIQKGRLDDPLLRQILPIVDENYTSDAFLSDPLEEQNFIKGPGLLQKYQHRALFVLTSACAIHCRYCFRRHFPYQNHRFSKKQMESLLEPIKSDPSITEVILSGGDPLSVSDDLLWHLIESLNQISQVKRLRIHTRLPLLIPSRVTDELLATLSQSQAKVVIVLHINHPQEIDPAVEAACKKLSSKSIVLLNQSVLLKGVNDQAHILGELSERLIGMNVLPYYLHQLDKVAGTTHFEVSEAVAKRILRELMAKLPGYLVPKYVKEVPGEAFKTPISIL